MDPSRPETPAEAEARRIREAARRRHPPPDPQHPHGVRIDPVSTALRTLPPGWSQVGVLGGDGEGRVLVGPGGVAVVWAFAPAGPVTLERGIVLDAGRPAAAPAETATARLRQLGGSAARRTTLVLCAATDVPVLRGADVVVCGAADLVRVVTGGPVVLGPGEVAGAGIRLAAALRQTRGPEVAATAARGRVPAVVAVVLALLLVAGLLLLGPRLGDGLGGLVGGCHASSASC